MSDAILPARTRDRLAERLRRLYGDGFDVTTFLASLDQTVASFSPEAMRQRLAALSAEPIASTSRLGLPRTGRADWTERDVVLITYADSLLDGDRRPLRVLADVLSDGLLAGCFSDVHLLPCFPFTSDDGFSVSDYETIRPDLGDWSDAVRLGAAATVAYDLVINHCSASHPWVDEHLSGHRRSFHEVDPATDLSQVTRPRSTPVLTPFDCESGQTVHLWTTFSADQLDLDFGDPDVLRRMLGVLLLYLAWGGRIIRLDAIAFLWKEIGTTCLHLPQTHEVVKLMRDIVDAVAPDAVLLTETNVPHAENVSYFGDGDEAHLVYQFSLAPLLLDAYVHGDAGYLNGWLASLESPPDGCTYFNFTASHDGVGVRPLEGLAPPERLEGIIRRVEENKGLVSMRRQPDGSESPYELNITWWSAIAVEDNERTLRRFLATQMIQLTLQGVPGVYVQSVFGLPNWSDGVSETGRARTINRRRLTLDQIERWSAEQPIRHRVLRGMRRLLAKRRTVPAFAPNASQEILDLGPGIVAVGRDAGAVVMLANVTDQRQRVMLGEKTIGLDADAACWIIDGRRFDAAAA